MNELSKARMRVQELKEKQMAIDETRLLLALARKQNDYYCVEVYEQELEQAQIAYKTTLREQAEVQLKVQRVQRNISRFMLDAWYVQGLGIEEIKDKLGLSVTRIADILKEAKKEYEKLWGHGQEAVENAKSDWERMAE